VVDVPDLTIITSDVPNVALSTSNPDVLLSSQYPWWFILQQSGMIPVALRTADIGNAAFDCM
jgi:hypothetical protein